MRQDFSCRSFVAWVNTGIASLLRITTIPTITLPQRLSCGVTTRIPKKWKPQPAATAKESVELIGQGHDVRTAKYGADKKIYPGVPVEVNLRIAKNEINYPISEMSQFQGEG